jgi:hypothetical protein
MKAGGDVYAGELRSYGILGDSDRDKDFSLIHVYHAASSNVAFRQLDADGILLNFADVEVLEIMKRLVPRHASERKFENDSGDAGRKTVKAAKGVA